jgi:hypothetical protein
VDEMKMAKKIRSTRCSAHGPFSNGTVTDAEKVAFEINIADPVADATEFSRLVAAVFKNVVPFKSIFQDADPDEYQEWDSVLHM